MKISHALSAGAILATAGAALAADTAPSPPPTRAQVRQQTLDAKAAGQIHAGEEPAYPVTPPSPPGKPPHLKKRHSAAAAKPAATADAAKP